MDVVAADVPSVSTMIGHEVSPTPDSIRNTSNAIEALAKESQGIGHILEVNQEVADQANLLALNSARYRLRVQGVKQPELHFWCNI